MIDILESAYEGTREDGFLIVSYSFLGKPSYGIAYVCRYNRMKVEFQVSTESRPAMNLYLFDIDIGCRWYGSVEAAHASDGFRKTDPANRIGRLNYMPHTMNHVVDLRTANGGRFLMTHFAGKIFNLSGSIALSDTAVLTTAFIADSSAELATALYRVFSLIGLGQQDCTHLVPTVLMSFS
jgi:hypothetical protein